MLTDDDRRYLQPRDYEHYTEDRLVQIADARRRHDACEAKASENWTPYSDEWMAENALLELEDIVANGLNPVYDEPEEYLSDFFSNFTWDPDRSRYEMRSILNDPRFIPVNEYFNEQLGLDLKAILEQAIETGDEG
jgi:hypothetical protein